MGDKWDAVKSAIDGFFSPITLIIFVAAAAVIGGLLSGAEVVEMVRDLIGGLGDR